MKAAASAQRPAARASASGRPRSECAVAKTQPDGPQCGVHACGGFLMMQVVEAALAERLIDGHTSDPWYGRQVSSISCKVCGGYTALLAEADANRTCEDLKAGGPVFAPSGELVPYLRCQSCGLIFTSHFDGWSHAEFEARIYNADYVKTDPEFVAERPSRNARIVWEHFSSAPSALDYGGGSGALAASLRARGLADCVTYDPFSAEFSERPARRFGLVTSFETLEHVPDPLGTARDLAGFVEPPGVVFFSTLVQPDDIERIGSSWWYMAPRNGHITLHSRQSLGLTWAAQGMRCVSFGDVWHCAFSEPPTWAVPLLKRAQREITPA
ncbi:class I SAM-dependent methyltransferase [Phenylobacterium deserti]|uniref:Class I SAM-dependent methyltransferase n=1 Tax=Phenylobacterium deserti TaxID=1914756 RepID=A0A328AD63_9CAUL|nr:class I SAM-dependent methyltransferase [Phenylobacterium deserti]RAK52763.1 class I SAM-dependent methyltransferase [Phenylobacterium deserti]